MATLIQKIEAEVKRLLKDGLDSKYAYHNVEHTQNVVNQSVALASAMSISDLDIERLTIAAWFHDTGYIEGNSGHESRSAEIAGAFLAKEGYDSDAIDIVCSTILDTRYPQQPKTELGKILCDADLSGLGFDTYLGLTVSLRNEMAETCSKHLTQKEWLDGEVKFLSEHTYQTEAGRLLYDEQKAKNIAILKQMQMELPEENTGSEVKKVASNSKKAKPAKDKAKGYSRGVETMFRASAKTHINLSAMADNKANIMLSINAMILSVTLTVLIPKLDSNAHLIVPAVVLLLTCLGAMVVATLATRPNITKGKSSKEAIQAKKSNLLFFGNFHDMDLDEYEWGMKEMMNDNDFLYSSLSRDLYFLGKVLNTKYAYLRICYNIFMYGMIASVIAFGIALYYQSLAV